jgi:hypothetical protein
MTDGGVRIAHQAQYDFERRGAIGACGQTYLWIIVYG